MAFESFELQQHDSGFVFLDEAEQLQGFPLSKISCEAVLELLRAVVDWMGHVTGSRLRLLLALLLQHGERLRGRDRSDLRGLAEV